jgi:hypothetical protein
MKNKAIGCLLLSAAMAFAQGPGGFGRGGFGRGAFGRGGPGAERVVNGAPFSGVEVRTFQEQLANGNSINRTSRTTLYRDTMGRTRSEVTVTPDASTGKQPFTVITISDPVAGVRHVLDSSTMTSHSIRIPMARGGSGRGGRGNTQALPANPGRSGRSGSSAVTRAELGSQMKNGVLATGTRNTEVIPAGRIGNAQAITMERETWFSTELKRAVEVKITDPQRGNSTMELTNLVPGEPGASLFSVPPGYTAVAGRGGRGGFVRGGRGARQ